MPGQDRILTVAVAAAIFLVANAAGADTFKNKKTGKTVKGTLLARAKYDGKDRLVVRTDEGKRIVLFADDWEVHKGRDPRHFQDGGGSQNTTRQRRTTIPKPKNVPKYKIVEEESFDYSTVVRRGYRVSLDREMTRAELEAISWDIIQKKTKGIPVNAISIMFYLPGTDTGGAFTAGKAEWCPNGEWGDAGTVATGDYSKHKLAIRTGSAMGKVPEGTVAHSIPEAKRREIFLALVKAQDAGVGDTKAYEVIAKRYKVSVKSVRKIGVEGVIKGWPME